MKPIRIADLPRLMPALAAVNGKAFAHTASASDVQRWATDAEDQLDSLGIPKGQRVGAIHHRQSGEKLPSAYSARHRASHVKRTRATLLRRATGWFVINLAADDCWPQVAPTHMIVLTTAQDAIAVAGTRRKYRVAKEI